MSDEDWEPDDQTIKVLGEKTRVARKHHRCDDCWYDERGYGGIAPGQTYHELVFLDERGKFKVERRCSAKGGKSCLLVIQEAEMAARAAAQPADICSPGVIPF